MFIFNINFSKFKYILFIVLALVFILIFSLTVQRIFFPSDKNFTVEDSITAPDMVNLTPENYTDVLEAVYDNLETYKGQKICFSGYVHRVYDLKSNEFILARDMIISSDFQTLIVGFLCSSEEASNFENGTWVELSGTISEGEYHGTVPIIKVSSIKGIDKPENAYVYPPKDSYVPTSILF